MYGVLSFAFDGDSATEVKAVFADVENGEARVIRLTEDYRVPSEPTDAQDVNDVGVIYVEGEAEDDVAVACVYYDGATGVWWTEVAGEIPVDEAY